ncbi:DUF4949 domain-containing protein [Legionella qingyii]|uniref:DUF4949 domain-containing protein n=1 Tax=Legionella qingyii TaxID=2184757 RepID=A0A317U620_9GAMM|nr:DUF4949 domain-containing protein [Legionella qingyii]PWY57444.1 DUF4949 domain-containing protein [Legionella qingyii]RUR26525.1 DUF4949 domain-containing protein [Legionella qingyii]RUR27545.1 DUF4949 domain-containing protein [Legionella qingyii]
MSLGVKLSTFAAALVLAGSAFAEEAVCPKLSDIQSVGITMASQLGYNYYIGYSVNHYNTSSSWGFAIGPVEAESEEDTIDITNDILAGLTAPGIPESGQGDELVCIYETNNPDLFAVAIKDYEEMSPMKFKQYIHKAR